MKTLKIVLASLAVLACFASCQKEKEDGDKKKEEVPETPKSTECRLTKFTVSAGTFTLEGFVDQTDKSVEISYMPHEYEALSAATAVAVISEKATITPDPAGVIDYTVSGGVKFTVTAEDGTTSNEYTVTLAAAEFAEKVSKVWEKTFGEMGLAAKPDFGCGIGFCAVDKFAYCDLNVFNLAGEKVGTLNTTGITGLDAFNGQLATVSNDENGVLVAIACYNGTYSDGGTGVRSEVYAWLDGWDKAPTKIYGPTDYQCYYMSVAGDVKDDFILNLRTGAGNPQMHHVLVYKGGQYFKEDGGAACTWYGPMINHPGNDGCWGQMLSFFTSDPEDGFVVWDSVGASEFGESGNASSAFYVFNEGLSAYLAGTATETILRGGVNWTDWDADGRWYGYGNYSIGHVRAFVYNGQKYVVACSSSWPCNWITVQKADNIVLDDEETDEIDESAQNYLLKTDIIEGADQCAPCCAYVLDPATGTGHIVYASQAAKVVAYDITTEIL